MNRFFLFITLLILPTAVWSVDSRPSEELVKELIELGNYNGELLKVVKTNVSLDSQELKTSIKGLVDKELKGKPLNFKQSEMLKTRLPAIINSLKIDLGPEHFEEKRLKIFTEGVNEANCTGMINFLKSNSGKSWAVKLPLINSQIIQEMQSKFKRDSEYFTNFELTKADKELRFSEESIRYFLIKDSIPSDLFKTLSVVLVLSDLKANIEPQILKMKETLINKLKKDKTQSASIISNMINIIENEFAWANYENYFTRIVFDNLNPAEINGVVAFFRSPSGFTAKNQIMQAELKMRSYWDFRIKTSKEKANRSIKELVEELKAASTK